MDGTIKTIKEILIGMAVYLAVASIPVLIFTNDKVKGEGGLLAGGAAAVIMLLSMRWSVLHTVHMQKGYSVYMGLVSALRMLVVAAFLCAVGWFGWFNLPATFAGLLSLKAATYLQPFTGKLIAKATQKKQGR